MARPLMSVAQVASSLHVSRREVIRMAEEKLLPAQKVKGEWAFRSGEIWNWVEQNLHNLPARRAKDRHPQRHDDLLIEPVLKTSGIAVEVMAKTKASVLRELVFLAERVDSTIDPAALTQGLVEREKTGSTALQDGVAVPHPSRPVFCEGPVIAAIRTAEPVVFGQRDGGLTDLFFLICAPQHVEHLLYLGRLCRLLIDRHLQEALRDAADANSFASVLVAAERRLCEQD
jgi:mannitol/fructose-specific phosphotransferase system IIA component (Ntr-type)